MNFNQEEIFFIRKAIDSYQSNPHLYNRKEFILMGEIRNKLRTKQEESREKFNKYMKQYEGDEN